MDIPPPYLAQEGDYYVTSKTNAEVGDDVYASCEDGSILTAPQNKEITGYQDGLEGSTRWESW